MKTTCSSCGAVGNIPDGKLPAAGANIRCPSCSHVFFVAPEPVDSAPATAPEAAPPAPAPAPSATAPDPSPAKPHPAPVAAAPEPASAAPEPAAAGSPVAPSADAAAPLAKPRPVSASRPSPFGTSRPSSISVDAFAVGLPRDETTGPPEADVFSEFRDENTVPTAALSEDTAERLVAGYAQSGSGDQDVVSVPQTGDAEASQPRKSVVDRVAEALVTGKEDEETSLPLVRMASTARAPWRVRDALGMVYDFPELSALRTWLGSRSSHEGIQVSSDETSDWIEVSRARELQGLEPSGMRGARPSGVGRMTRSAATVIPAAPAGQGARAFSGAHTNAAALADRVASETKGAALSGREKRAEARSRRASRESDSNAKSGAVRRSEKAASRSKEASAADAKKAARQRTLMLGATLVLVAFGAVFALTRPSEVRIPATPAGIEAQWALDALNDASKAAVGEVQRRFEEQTLRETSAQTISDWFAFQDEGVPEFVLQRIERERGENEIALELMSTFGGRYLLTVVVEGPGPANVTTLNMQQVGQ